MIPMYRLWLYGFHGPWCPKKATKLYSLTPTVVKFHMVESEVLAPSYMYSVCCFIFIAGKLSSCFHYYHVVYDLCKDEIHYKPKVIMACFHIAPWNYHHYGEFFEALNIWNACQVHSAECVGKIRGPFYWHGLTLISAWKINYIHYKMCYENTYPFPNFNGSTVEVWEWILYWTCDYFSMLVLKLNHVSKREYTIPIFGGFFSNFALPSCFPMFCVILCSWALLWSCKQVIATNCNAVWQVVPVQ